MSNIQPTLQPFDFPFMVRYRTMNAMMFFAFLRSRQGGRRSKPIPGQVIKEKRASSAASE